MGVAEGKDAAVVCDQRVAVAGTRGRDEEDGRVQGTDPMLPKKRASP